MEHEHIGRRWPPLTRAVTQMTGHIPACAPTQQNLESIEKRIGGDATDARFNTGLPAKSGVGGGLIVVSPGTFGIAVVSPPRDDAGSSVHAQRAIAAISNALGGHRLVPTAR